MPGCLSMTAGAMKVLELEQLCKDILEAED
jgi:hypothetical protein